MRPAPDAPRPWRDWRGPQAQGPPRKWRWTHSGYNASGLSVQSITQELARLEERHMLFINIHRLAGAGIATCARIAAFDREGAETAQLHPVSIGHRIGDFVENGIHDALDVALVKMWIFFGNFLNQLRPDHWFSPGFFGFWRRRQSG